LVDPPSETPLQSSVRSRGEVVIETFENIRFKPATLARIEHANEIIDEYQALGFTLTLRQLFYQFVSRPALGLENSVGDDKRLGRTLSFQWSSDDHGSTLDP
jgi:hypothetical protein